MIWLNYADPGSVIHLAAHLLLSCFIHPQHFLFRHIRHMYIISSPSRSCGMCPKEKTTFHHHMKYIMSLVITGIYHIWSDSFIMNLISSVHLVLRYCKSGTFSNGILILRRHDFYANFGFVWCLSCISFYVDL